MLQSSLNSTVQFLSQYYVKCFMSREYGIINLRERSFPSERNRIGLNYMHEFQMPAVYALED